jgi:hypothetical protein
MLLKAEARLIIAGMTGSPFASLRGRTTTPNAVAAAPFATKRAAGDWREIFIPIGHNPLKSPDSKK